VSLGEVMLSCDNVTRSLPCVVDPSSDLILLSCYCPPGSVCSETFFQMWNTDPFPLLAFPPKQELSRV